VLAGTALFARIGLSTNTNTVADLEAISFFAYTRDSADDLVSDVGKNDQAKKSKFVSLVVR